MYIIIQFFFDRSYRYKLSFYLNKALIQIKYFNIFLTLSDSHLVYKCFLIARDHSPYRIILLDFHGHNN